MAISMDISGLLFSMTVLLIVFLVGIWIGEQK